MRIEPKQAFYNDATGAVQPWKDIEVTDAVGNTLVSEGLAIAIAEGGGGGGDLETAAVTITAPGDEDFFGNGAWLTDELGDPASSGSIYVEKGTSATVDIILYKEKALIGLGDPISTSRITVTGGVEVYSEPEEPGRAYGFFVTGDGTITIAEA